MMLVALLIGQAYLEGQDACFLGIDPCMKLRDQGGHIDLIASRSHGFHNKHSCRKEWSDATHGLPAGCRQRCRPLAFKL